MKGRPELKKRAQFGKWFEVGRIVFLVCMNGTLIFQTLMMQRSREVSMLNANSLRDPWGVVLGSKFICIYVMSLTKNLFLPDAD